MALPRVLLVEDEILIRMYLRKQLEKLGVQVVAETGDSREVEHLVLRHVPDLVIMDIKIQGPRDGIEVARSLVREHPVPVVFISAYELGAEDIPMGDSFLGAYRKPVSLQSLRNIVELLETGTSP